ncbi:carboxylate-amine ligase [Pelagovum pacificum]|uniref:Putative glutamate--cysteine ligase 2 n=1 Tax=Pelagovum pacificum TaxID=2588711 RepID=A0A5C5GCB0_9RHOB|nr:carboxylate-amine ligase [Pelagovum pacificum]QQA44492.1 carboxylate-amine ligase [Pelagovum pacificum]TNY32393.1 carboxylate-amine ligase [Pelagovum pacificum]
MAEPDFTLGIEEEYLLVDKETLALREAPEGLLEACQAQLGDQVSPEYLQCQIEIGTGVCATIPEARDDLRRLRRVVSDEAAKVGLAPIAASCHPLADWKQQHHTDKARYNQLRDDLGGVVRRMLICGMHVHVGLNDDALRADLLNQMAYFLPHLLALSASSPFWQGEDTGLASYRISVFDNLPRTGLPPRIDSWEEYERSVGALIDIGVIEDASKIWWDLRPSSRFPTLESRICDVSPRLSHAISLAALTQCLARMLWRLRRLNQRWRRYENFLVSENRWRAQRYGIGGGLIDFGRHEIVPVPALLEELIELVAEDAEALGCVAEVEATRDIIRGGTSADRQRAVYKDAEAAGEDRDGRMRAVVRHLIEEYHADL